MTGLFVGIAIAIPSGMGVALSVLGNNTSSLVGVAISASLLPPLVNAGMLWCVWCSCVLLILFSFLSAPRFLSPHVAVVRSGDRGHAVFGDAVHGIDVDSDYFAELGALSFCLTAINIVLIFLFAGLMFLVCCVSA